MEHYRRHAEFKPALVYCTSVKSAEDAAQAFRDHGYKFVRLDGESAKDFRAQSLVDLANGTIHGVCSCDLISEGVDVPRVECGILLRPTESLGLAWQQIGRTLRPAEGKEYAVLLDHAGNIRRHGLPTTGREWDLSNGVKKQSVEAKEKTRQCEQCFHVHEWAPECPECGYVYPVKSREVEQVDGALEALTDEAIRDMEELKAKRKEQGMATTMEELIKIGIQRGMKNPRGWAWHVFNARKKKGLVTA